MVTKLKSVSRLKITKVVAFLLMVAAITAAVAQVQYIAFRGLDPEIVLVKDYKDSNDFAYEATKALNEVPNVYDRYEIPEDCGYYYYFYNGKKEFDNIPDHGNYGIPKDTYMNHNECYYSYEDGIWTFGTDTNPNVILPTDLNKDSKLFVAFQNYYLEQKQMEWENNKQIIPLILSTLLCILVAILMLVTLSITAGRVQTDNTLHLTKIDLVYSDVLLVVLILLLSINVSFQIVQRGQSDSYVGFYEPSLTMNEKYAMIFIIAISILTSSMIGCIYLSLIRQWKAKMILKNSILYKLITKGIKFLSDFFKSLFINEKINSLPYTKVIFYRQLIFIGTSAGFVIISMLLMIAENALFLIFFFLEAFMIYWYIKGNQLSLEDISKEFSERVEEQMKAERMKVDLITNVSHDLKTPLTSIISYVDLLSKEELPEIARDYVKILSDKSNRLKNIVVDLFDLAKSTSGDISVNIEILDLKRLMEQTMADMDENMKNSGLFFKIKIPETAVNIRSDGKRLYRVFQNVFDNAIKYSMKGTRVYVNH
ncbi:MAG: hypothetical protein K0S47_1187 [Herbinix sp.]|nr:hypothetical protein [Herbinix sp.]